MPKRSIWVKANIKSLLLICRILFSKILFVGILFAETSVIVSIFEEVWRPLSTIVYINNQVGNDKVQAKHILFKRHDQMAGVLYGEAEWQRGKLIPSETLQSALTLQSSSRDAKPYFLLIPPLNEIIQATYEKSDEALKINSSSLNLLEQSLVEGNKYEVQISTNKGDLTGPFMMPIDIQ